MTPSSIARALLSRIELSQSSRVLEPGFGTGSFLLPLVERFLELRNGDLKAVLTENVWGVEIDRALYDETLRVLDESFGSLPAVHNLVCGDFLTTDYDGCSQTDDARPSLFPQSGGFDLVLGNPPFGGTVSLAHQNLLERRFGTRGGLKIKKESYSFFIVKALDHLRKDGRLVFICSDTFLTIPTMKGLRNALMTEGSSELVRLDEFSPETSYPMVVLSFTKGREADAVLVDHRRVPYAQIKKTQNYSWRVSDEFAQFFEGPTLGEYVVCSSGMTTGKNEFFVRSIEAGCIEEALDFEFFDDPVTLEREIERARLGEISARLRASILARQASGETRRNVRAVAKQSPVSIQLPHSDYRLYNKAQPGLVYADPKYAIFWKDAGDAVLTYKRNGNWYLHGVGGAPFFGREGITWRLIAAQLDARYLPAGYILDSGAPCAFLREGVEQNELWFILGWMLTNAATRILKGVLNHTLNIQSKDVERLPYPWWVDDRSKQSAICLVESLVARAMVGEQFERGAPALLQLESLYVLHAEPNVEPRMRLVEIT